MPTVGHLFKKLTTFYETEIRRLIIVLTSGRHWSQSKARLIKSTPASSKFVLQIYLHLHLSLSSGFFLSVHGPELSYLSPNYLYLGIRQRTRETKLVPTSELQL